MNARLAALAMLCIAAAHVAPSGVVMAENAPPSAADTDPARTKPMQGFPVPKPAQVRWDDGSMWRFPNTRWTFTHVRELVPTVGIRRGPRPAVAFPRAERTDLDAIPFTALDGRAMTWRESLDANYTDGIVVVHRGRIVYERYFGALGPDDQHLAMSVTKSFVGTLAELLIAEGRLDPARTVASYVPELAASGFGDATVRQVMDMRTGLAYSEDYTGLGSALSDATKLMLSAAWAPAPKDYVGPDGLYAYAATLAKDGGHGGDFVYRTPNTIVLSWIVERATGASLARQFEQRFWTTIGMEQDASLAVDRLGTAFGGGGLSTSLRDLARFGEMIRLGGRFDGRQILPASVAAAVMKGGDAAAFVNAKYPGLDGGSYASQWWHRAGGQTIAAGIHGQGIYIDPKAELVIARFASHPIASNRSINPVTIPAYDALTAYLKAHPTQR